MPYSVGSKGSNGCSGYPVVTDSGKVVGCHPTEAEANDHMQALYANVPDASKADEASVQTSDVPENPSNSLNPAVGIKHPEYLKHDPNNANCKCDKCMQVKSLFSDFGKDHTKSQRLI